jgi:hypothetical protein
MQRATVNLIAVVEGRDEGWADVPPGLITPETEIELAEAGYACGTSDHLWLGGVRIYSPEAILYGLVQHHVPASIFTAPPPKHARIPEARPDFPINAILEMRKPTKPN